MMAITCAKCRRRYTPAVEELQGYLQQAEGKKHVVVLCPHCGKGNKVAHASLVQALSGPFSAAPLPPPAAAEVPGAAAASAAAEVQPTAEPPAAEAQTPGE